MGRVPEKPTQGFFTNPNPTRTQKRYDKLNPNQTRPENPKKPKYAKNMYFYQNIHKVFTEKVRPKFFL